MLDPVAEIRALVDRHGTAPRTATPLRGLTLFRTEQARPPVDTMYRPSLCLVVQGRKRVVLGKQVFEYDSSRYLIVSVELPVTGCIVQGSAQQPYLGLTIDLDPAEIARMLLEMPPLPSPQEAPENAPAAIMVAPRDDRLLEPVVRLLRCSTVPKRRPSSNRWSGTRSCFVCFRARKVG